MKSLADYISENLNNSINESTKIDVYKLRDDIKDLLENWIETGDSKRAEIKNIKSIIKDPSLNNGNVDDLISQLVYKRKYDEKQVSDFLSSKEGVELLKAAAEWVIEWN